MALEWQMAMQWIQSTDIDQLRKQNLAKIENLPELAQYLRDGVILCMVANALKSGCIKDISKSNVQKHEVCKQMLGLNIFQSLMHLVKPFISSYTLLSLFSYKFCGFYIPLFTF